MKWDAYDSPAAQHARTHARAPNAPPHWTRCEVFSSRGKRCLRPEHVDSHHDFGVKKRAKK